MGSCCGKQSDSDADPFSRPGRTLGSAPAQGAPASNRAPIPAASKAPPKVGGPGHTLGASNPGEDPRAAAAKAAEARAQKKSGSGSLESQLAAQKKRGMAGALQDSSEENRRARDLDAARDARSYN